MDVVVAAITLTCWLMSLYKLRDLFRDRQNLPLRALWVALVTITVSLSIQPLAPQLDRVVGRLDVSRVTSNCLTLISAAAAQAFLLYMTDTGRGTRVRVRRRLIAMAGCVAVIAVLYAVAPAPYAIDDPHVVSMDYYRGLPRPFSPPYTFVYLFYLGYAMVEVAVLAGRYARIATRPLLRAGLRLIVVGALMAVPYILLKFGVVVVADHLAHPVLGVDDLIVACFTLSVVMILVGSTMPSWGPMVGLDRLCEWIAALAAYRRLHPLWALVRAARPQIALLPEPRGPLGHWHVLRQAPLRLVRRVVEIRDGYLALRLFASQRAVDVALRHAAAAGLVGVGADAAVEAAVVAVALHGRRLQQPPTGAARSPLDPAEADATADHNGPAAEVAWLIMVADAIRRSPVVAATVAELGE